VEVDEKCGTGHGKVDTGVAPNTAARMVFASRTLSLQVSGKVHVQRASGTTMLLLHLALRLMYVAEGSFATAVSACLSVGKCTTAAAASFSSAPSSAPAAAAASSSSTAMNVSVSSIASASHSLVDLDPAMCVDVHAAVDVMDERIFTTTPTCAVSRRGRHLSQRSISLA
jgi:hypothetical protein